MRDLKCKDCGQNVHEEDYMLKDGFGRLAKAGFALIALSDG